MTIEGNVLRRSFDRASGKSPLNVVRAAARDRRLVLARIATDAKSNEITAVPALLKMLSLKGTIATTDSLDCSGVIAQQILDQGGDYALPVKDYQGTFLDDVGTLEGPASKTSTARATVQADRHRIKTCEATVSTDIGWLPKGHPWPELAAVGKVVHMRKTAAQITPEAVYYLLSSTLSPERFGDLVSSHRGIENPLHWRLDVVMNKGQDRSGLGNGPNNLAVLRQMALNVVQRSATKGSLRRKFKRAGWDSDFLCELIALFQHANVLDDTRSGGKGDG
jgi:predicted transposase YbfD/YdcC